MSQHEHNSAGDKSSAEKAFMYQDLGHKLSLGKLVFLGLVTLGLCSFGPLSFFASVPISVAILLYGRPKSFGLIGCFFILTSILAYNFPPISYLPFIYLLAGVLGTLNAEVILRKWHPFKGIIFFGMILVSFAFLVGISVAIFSEKPPSIIIEDYVIMLFDRVREQNQELFAAGGEQARTLDDFLSQPKEVANEILNWAPSMIFVLTFFSLWACQFLILRNSIIWKLKHAYPYSAKELVNFKVPDIFLYPFILSLGLVVLSSYIPEWLRVSGQNVLYGVCVFYFFQGFGVYSKFLDFAKIFGFLRTFLVLFTLTAAWRIILLFGILDTWVDFRGRLDRRKEQ